jgi:peptidoglycan/xylan/chitin deacetylase (PgdA/CDA1 family)
MDVTVGHRHGWVVALAGVAAFGLIVSAATAQHGTAVPRARGSIPNVSATTAAIRRAARPMSVPAATPRGTHARAPSAPARPSMSARSSTACRNGYVALSFDDGPDPASTPRLLAALRRAALRATFFDIGQRVAEYPQLARQSLAYGNAVEDHTWDHRSLTGASTRTPTPTAQQVIDELDRAKQAIVSATGLRPQFVRPPYGDTSPAVQRLADQLGLIEVGWTVDSTDYAGISTRQLVATVLHLRPGDVVIMHDAARDPDTIAGIPAIAAGLHARGLCAGRLIPSRSGTPGWQHGTFHAQPAAW